MKREVLEGIVEITQKEFQDDRGSFMEKKIRSISISEVIDNKLIDDSKSRGLTISANITRILFDYFKNQPKETDRILKL